MRALILWLLAENGSVLGVQKLGYPNYQSRRYRNVPLPDSLRE